MGHPEGARWAAARHGRPLGARIGSRWAHPLPAAQGSWGTRALTPSSNIQMWVPSLCQRVLPTSPQGNFVCNLPLPHNGKPSRQAEHADFSL